jgi:hypothetical protein
LASVIVVCGKASVARLSQEAEPAGAAAIADDASMTASRYPTGEPIFRG